MKRNRKAKILATLGPASSDKKIIEDLFAVSYTHLTLPTIYSV